MDEVREGSTVRCEMNVHSVDQTQEFKTSLVFIHMSGVQSESMPKPKSVQENEYRAKKGEFFFALNQFFSRENEEQQAEQWQGSALDT